jgi:phage protein D
MAVAEALDVLRSSHPTIRLAGTESESLTGGLMSARGCEDVHGLSSCELEIGNWGPTGGDEAGYLYFGRDVLDFGKALEIRIGSGTLFSGKITAIEARFGAGAAPTVVALAEDRFQDLRMTRRTRAFADVSDADVVAQIAGDHGLTPDAGISGPTHRLLAQLNQSDLAFLRERARALDAELWLTDSTLHVQPRAARRSPPLTLTYGKDLHELQVAADLAHQRTTGDEARARAEALLKRRARRFVVGHGTTDSQPGLRVGATVRLAGIGPLFEGEYYLSAVTHLFDGALGLRSELCVERAAVGRRR